MAVHQRALGFGRTLIYTDQHEWSDEEIVRAYRSKAVIEEEFRRLKDTVLRRHAGIPAGRTRRSRATS